MSRQAERSLSLVQMNELRVKWNRIVEACRDPQHYVHGETLTTVELLAIAEALKGLRRRR